MPYLCTNKAIPEKLKRNTKLTKEQKEEIYWKYHNEYGWSWQKLADVYKVSKKTIGLTVNKEFGEQQKANNKDNYKKYKPTKEKRAEYMKTHRQYKYELSEKGLLL